MRYLIVSPDGNVVHGQGALDMAALQTLVGGDFEVLPSPDGIAATVLAGTESKAQGAPANHPATRLIRNRIRPEDFVAGVIVVTGPIAEDGSLTEIDEPTERLVLDRIRK
jgi:hypothetical protein